MRPTISEWGALGAAVALIVTSLVVVGTRDTAETTAASPLTQEFEPPATTAPPGATPRPAAGGRATARPDATAPSTIQTTAAPPATPPRGTAGPPALGTYVYAETNPEGTQDSTFEVTSQGGGRRVENHDSGRAVSEVEWRPDAKYVRVSTFRTPGGDVRCDWNPDFVQFKFPLRRGIAWTIDSRCRPNATSTIAVKGSARVTGARQRTVGGERVAVWVVISDVTFTFSGNGASFSQAVHDEEDFAPSHGLTVFDVLTTTGTAPSGEQSRRRTTRVLKSLRPA